MNNKIYRQADSRWGNLPYPTKRYSFAGNGCGCCACLHIAIEQKSKAKWTPKKLRPWMVKQGFATCGNGTLWEGITKTLIHIGHEKVVRIYRNDPMKKAFKELNKGNRIGIILFSSGHAPNGIEWTSSGHYVAFTNYRIKDGRHEFYTKDSGARNHNGWHSYERSMKGLVSQMWIVERIQEKKTSYKGKYPSNRINTKTGSKQNILKWQKFLNWWSGKQVLEEDGSFGRITEKITKKFQSKYGLAVDGSVGSATLKEAKRVGKTELH